MLILISGIAVIDDKSIKLCW